MLQRILETLDSDETDIKLKSIFVEARDIVANQIAEDLAEFRHKRMIGLGSLYGEQKLTGGPAHGVGASYHVSSQRTFVAVYYNYCVYNYLYIIVIIII